MLSHKFFHRAKKVVVSEQELKGKQKKKEKKSDEKDDKEENRKEKKTVEEAESSHAEGCKEEKCLVRLCVNFTSDLVTILRRFYPILYIF